tara:strand:- start:2158 stop:2310 length:153 start_codon:yes stop_codon:yes gene_type:complete
LYFGRDQGNAGDLSKIGKEKGKTEECQMSCYIVATFLLNCRYNKQLKRFR